MEIGFGSVFAGPLVRSSYRAEEQRLAAEGGSRVVAY
jgi:lipoate synthase